MIEFIYNYKSPVDSLLRPIVNKRQFVQNDVSWLIYIYVNTEYLLIFVLDDKGYMKISLDSQVVCYYFALR